MPTKNKTIKNYDNTTIGRYIRAVENPDSAGFDHNRRVWFNPREDKSKKNRLTYDANSRGMGVDIKYNNAARNYTNGVKGKELTEEEERYFRNLHIQESLDALKRQTSKRGIPYPNDAFLEAMAVGAIYRGDANELWDKHTPMGKAIRETDDAAEWKFRQAANQFYRGINMAERANNSEKFLDSGTLQTQVVPEYKIVKPSKMKLHGGNLFEEGGYIKDSYGNTVTFDKEVDLIKAEGGSLNQAKPWNNLSIKEKADIMKVAIQNGITTLPEIKAKYNEFAEGGNLFSGTENHSSLMHQGHVYDVLPRMLKNAGLDVRVTSGYRKAGAAGKAGSKSWHTRHGAVDIVPQGKTTFSDIEDALYNNPEISSYMLANGFGLIDESGRTEESKATMRKTGATGAHFHIGKDSAYAKRYADRMAKNVPQIIPESPSIQTYDAPAFMPSNPQTFFNPFVYQAPQIEPEMEQPLVEAALNNAYTPEQLEREQRMNNLNTLSMVLGMTSPQGSDNSFVNTLGMLAGNMSAYGGKKKEASKIYF